jgi:hypothetical protein
MADLQHTDRITASVDYGIWPTVTSGEVPIRTTRKAKPIPPRIVHKIPGRIRNARCFKCGNKCKRCTCLAYAGCPNYALR